MVVINDYEVALKVARDRRFLGRQPSYIAAELRYFLDALQENKIFYYISQVFFLIYFERQR